MTYTCEVKGRTADRFRAYVDGKSTRRVTTEDQVKRISAGHDPLPSNARVAFGVHLAAVEGAVTLRSADDRLFFDLDAGDKEVTHVAFYAGAGDEEVVVGSVEVGASGKIEVEFLEPVDPAEPVVVNEADL